MVQRLTMSVCEMAQQLGISKPIAYELARQEGFPALRIGKRVIIPVLAFQEWLTKSADTRAEIAMKK